MILRDTERQSRACPLPSPERFSGRKKFLLASEPFRLPLYRRVVFVASSPPKVGRGRASPPPTHTHTCMTHYALPPHRTYDPVTAAAFFISRHVSQKVTLPVEWHIFLAGTINSHQTKITGCTMNNGPYFCHNLLWPRARARAHSTQRHNDNGTTTVAVLSMPRFRCIISVVLAMCPHRNKNKNKERISSFFFNFEMSTLLLLLLFF